MAALQSQYRNVLLQQEERHVEEKRGLVESYLLKLSAVEAQLGEAKSRVEDLVQLQSVSDEACHDLFDLCLQEGKLQTIFAFFQVMESEHEMEVRELRQQLKRAHHSTKDARQEEYVRGSLRARVVACCLSSTTKGPTIWADDLCSNLHILSLHQS